MHAAHFHSPRPVAVLVAAVLATLVTLAITTSVNDISLSTRQGARSAPVARPAPTPLSATQSTTGPSGSTPAWAGNPFSPLRRAPMTPIWDFRSGK